MPMTARPGSRAAKSPRIPMRSSQRGRVCREVDNPPALPKEVLPPWNLFGFGFWKAAQLSPSPQTSPVDVRQIWRASRCPCVKEDSVREGFGLASRQQNAQTAALLFSREVDRAFQLFQAFPVPCTPCGQPLLFASWPSQG